MKTKKIFINLLKNSQGFSLVEVLVALSILAVGLLGVAGMQIMSVSGNSFGRETQMAILAGQEFFETIQTLDSNARDFASGEHKKPKEGEISQDTLAHIVAPDISNPNFRFIREWNVVNGVPFTGSQEITVTISWKNSSGDHAIDMHTTRLR